MRKPKINIDIGSREELSALVRAPFDVALSRLHSKGYRVVSSEDLARLRIQEGIDADVSQYNSFTREGFIFLRRGIYLTKNSPIINNPEKAVKDSLENSTYCPTPEEIDVALNDSIRIKPENSDIYGIEFCRFSIPLEAFGEEEITSFLFGKQAREYGTFLKESGVEKLSFELRRSMPSKLFYLSQDENRHINYSSQLNIGGLYSNYVQTVEGNFFSSLRGCKVRGIKDISSIEDNLSYLGLRLKRNLKS